MPDKMKAVAEAKRIAADNKHGYSQANRNGRPDYDCSSLVIHCLDYAGFPMSKYGATYTGNMIPALKKCGFKDVTRKINLKTGTRARRSMVRTLGTFHTWVKSFLSDSFMAGLPLI